MNRKEIEEGHRLVALYGDAHDDLIKALKIRSFESTKEEQAAYELARAFWVREYPAMRKRLIDALGTDTQLEHSFYVLRKSYESVKVEDAIRDLRDYAHVKDLDEARTAARDLWERYEAHLNREVELIPTRAAVNVARAKGVGGWIASRPDWIEAHPQTVRIGLIAVVLALAWQAPSILREATELLKVVLGR